MLSEASDLPSNTGRWLKAVMLRAGGVTLMRRYGRHGVRILLYHRFPTSTRASLEAQCVHLRTYYNLVSLDQVAGWLRNGDVLPHNALAVTVDDGYRDFYQNAFPVFSAYDIPITVFLATDFLDRGEWLWVDRVNYLCKHTRLQSAIIPLGARTEREVHFHSRAQRSESSSLIRSAAKKMENGERRRLIELDLPRLLNVAVPPAATEDYEPMRWDEIRHMATRRIDFGAHTQSHPILSSVLDREMLANEIQGSQRRIEEQLDKPVLHFSYPNGTWDDITSGTVDIVKQAFHTAVVAQGGINFVDDDPFLLRRNTVDPSSSELIFGRFATGFRRQ
jgi:peptidoglycan/xylan/chitin deacetylase (PgdA/CDA1 family)